MNADLFEPRAGGSVLIAILLIALGLVAIVEPLVAGLAMAVVVGWLLIVGGFAHAIGAFGIDGAGRTIWQLLLALLYVASGTYFLAHPLLGLGTLTLFLAAILLAEATLRIVAFFQARYEGGAVWLLVNGLVTLLLGAMIGLQWPVSSVWAVGTLVGVNLLMAGLSRLMLRAALRSIA